MTIYKKRGRREVNIEEDGTNWLTANGCIVAKMGKEGWPDRIVFVGNGTCFFWEAKTPTGQQEAAQKLRIDKLIKMGYWVAVGGMSDLKRIYGLMKGISDAL